MIETRPDWCLLDKLGVPFPIFISKNQKFLIDEEVFENIAKIYVQEICMLFEDTRD